MYRQVLDQNSIKLSCIYACERNLVLALDLSAMCEPGLFDTFVELMASAGYPMQYKSALGSYIENYMLQLLVERGFVADVVFNCLVAALFFFVGNGEICGREAVVRAFKMGYQINSAFLKKVDKALAQLSVRLKMKGNSSEVVEDVLLKIDHGRIFA